MQRIDHTSNIPLSSGADPVEATVSPGYFRRPSALLGNQGTVVTADWLNDIQEELASVITTNGQTLAKGSNALLHAAIESQIDGNVTTHAGLISNESVLGHLEVATSAEVVTGTNNARAMTPHNLMDAFVPGSNANGNWLRFPTATANPFILQWGTLTGAGGTWTVTMPQTMANTDYSLSAMPSSTVTDSWRAGTNKTTTSFVGYNSHTNSLITWMVMGFSA